MENKNKAINLFKYIIELYTQKQKVVTEIEGQKWFKFISDIPKNIENIKINYMDRNNNESKISNEEYQVDNNVLCEIKKIDFEKAPKLPKALESWIENGWNDFNNKLNIIERKIKIIDEKEEIENFEDLEDRIESFKKFSQEREIWVERQKAIEKTRILFNELYVKYIDLNRDSDNLEMMIGQGILKCDISNSKKVYHPLLLKRVNLNFDALNNIIKIVDTNSEEELYTMLLQEMDFINHSVIKILKEELAENFYHPLDRIETVKFLKTLTHSLHSESKYVDIIEEATENIQKNEKIVIYNKPVFFVRKKSDGVTNSIEEIIEQLEKTGDISGPLLNLVGANLPMYTEKKEEKNISEILSEISGEDRNILLAKEANREQLEIAKRIENYNAVLVQGPPGTGKTHTIANLMGHFLAQGKNVLVTSHTKKALSVVKEKLSPELQNLCVSVLDDNNKDMEKSVDGIIDFISSHSSIELEKKIDELSKNREGIFDELDSIRKKIYEIKSREFDGITYDNKIYSIVEIAKFIHDYKEELSFIPGKINFENEKNSFPLTNNDIEFLYQSNALLSLEEEQEIGSYLPNPTSLITVENFRILISNNEAKFEEDKKVINRLHRSDISFDNKTREFFVAKKRLINIFDENRIKSLKDFLEINLPVDHKLNEIKDWTLFTITDGKKGGGYKAIWEKFLQKIEQTYNYAGNSKNYLLGKKVEINFTKSNQTISILKEMKEHVAKGKKVNSFSFFKPKEWIEIYENIKLDNNSLENVEEYDAIIAYIELLTLRDELSKMWYEIIEKNGGESFKSFGDEPEQKAIKYVEKIKKSLVWYDETYKKIKELMIEANINTNLLIEDEDFIYNGLDKLKKVLQTLYFDLYNCLEFLIDINSNLDEKNRELEYNNTQEILSAEKARNSNIAKEILKALQNKDIEDYENKYKKLLNLSEKKEIVEKRLEILNILENLAPEWSKNIRNRIDIHGKSQVPKNIQEAWKWKVFQNYLEDINKISITDIQNRALILNKELKKISTQLVENLAWYKLIKHIDNDVSQKQTLQGWKLTVKKIGKGTGKTTPALKKEAKKLMAKCQMAVPAWVMPINKALENLDPKTNKFDIVIIDEASQSDISALAILYFAKKIIIVGDDEQVSPSAVGIDIEKTTNLANMYIKDLIPNYHLYDMKSSLYDIAKTTFPTLMLKEHFRCVPDIIGYSNRLAYDYKIKALRDDSLVPTKPATIAYQILDGKRDENKKINEKEAKNIVALMKACMEFEEYKDMSFGAISLLGDEQAEKINQIAIEKINPLDFEKRKILCGNASQFQGDERDIIFISLVDSNEDKNSQLRLVGEGIGKAIKQRYNVAASRAKNQLWIVHSLDVEKNLKINDMRREIIEYAKSPQNFKENKSIKYDEQSELGKIILENLQKEGYNIIPNWRVGSYNIAMVARYKDKKVAIEYNNENLKTEKKDFIRINMEKQTVLERLGWRFINIRASEYYFNPEKSLKKILEELNQYGIQNENHIENRSEETLKEKVIKRAGEILANF